MVIRGRMTNSPPKELRSLMLDLRQVVAIVLLLVEGLWKIIRSNCDYETLEEQFQALGQQALTRLFSWMLEKMDERLQRERDPKRYELITLKNALRLRHLWGVHHQEAPTTGTGIPEPIISCWMKPLAGLPAPDLPQATGDRPGSGNRDALQEGGPDHQPVCTRHQRHERLEDNQAGR